MGEETSSPSRVDTSLYFEGIVNDIAHGIICLDFSGKIITYNKAAEAILQKSSSKVLHQSFWTVFDDMYFGFSMRAALAQKLLVKAARATIANESIHKPQIIESTTSFMPEGMILCMHDITPILLMEKLTTKKNHAQEMQEMAAMLAHEIRNPLGGLKGFASILKRDLSDLPKQQRLATYIATGIDDLEKTLNDALNHYHHLHREKTDLVQLLNELVCHMQADASIGPKIKLDCKSSHALIEAYIDPLALKSALLNLCSNAIKAMPKGGALTLEVEEAATETRIKVCDTGEGISTENLERLFEPSFTTHPQGHGFGLSEVLQVVEAHHGTIETLSEVGKGTTFTIRIPHHPKGFI